jgi:haloacetate dehalogenase
MTDKTNIERRTFVQAMTAASVAALSSSLLSHRATAQLLDKATSAASGHFETAEIRTDDNTIFIRRYGNGSRCSWFMGFREPA